MKVGQGSSYQKARYDQWSKHKLPAANVHQITIKTALLILWAIAPLPVHPT